MIEVKHLTKRYGKNAVVKDLSFTIETGKIYGFLGPNGAGKSTTMNMLTGCLAMSEGEVSIGGYDIIAQPEMAKRLIGYLPEQPPLYPDMTPKEYLTFVASAKGVEKGRIAAQVESVMEETHITSMKDRMIRNLSKGYKQRVGIAQAMLGDPKLIILDEPTVGLDPMQIIEIRDLIMELGRTRTVLLSSHILAEIQAVCDHVMILSHGKLVANGTLDDIRRKYAGDNVMTLTVKGSEKQVISILQSLKHVRESELTEGEMGRYRVRITVEGDRDIAEDVFFAFAKNSCPILAMQSSAMTLEDVFLKLTADPVDQIASEEETVPMEERLYGKADKSADVDDDDCDADEDDDDDDEDDDETDDADDGDDDYVPLFGGRKAYDEEEDDE